MVADRPPESESFPMSRTAAMRGCEPLKPAGAVGRGPGSAGPVRLLSESALLVHATAGAPDPAFLRPPRNHLPEVSSRLWPAASWALMVPSVNQSGKVANTAIQSIIAPRGPRFNAPAWERTCRDLLLVFRSSSMSWTSSCLLISSCNAATRPVATANSVFNRSISLLTLTLRSVAISRPLSQMSTLQPRHRRVRPASHAIVRPPADSPEDLQPIRLSEEQAIRMPKEHPPMPCRTTHPAIRAVRSSA